MQNNIAAPFRSSIVPSYIYTANATLSYLLKNVDSVANMLTNINVDVV